MVVGESIVNIKGISQDFPGGPVVRLRAAIAGGLGSTPGQGTRSHMLQLRPSVAK